MRRLLFHFRILPVMFFLVATKIEFLCCTATDVLFLILSIETEVEYRSCEYEVEYLELSG